MVLCVSEGAQQRAEQVSLYSCCCSVVLPLVEVADVSVSHQALPAPARRSRSGLAVDRQQKQRHGFVECCMTDGGRWWQSLEESGQRRMMG